jgi:hypothetical protein
MVFRRGIDQRFVCLRGACQDWAIRAFYRFAARSNFTMLLQTINWLPTEQLKAAFIPIGANIPEPVACRRALPLPDEKKAVVVFGMMGATRMAREIAGIAGIMQEASKTLKKLRLVVVGRGSIEAREQLADALRSWIVRFYRI